MRDGKICNTGGNIAQKFCPIICYTINSTASGGLDYLYLHEYIHAIESNSLNGSDYISGFDITSSKNHRYNPSKREYELINEIIVDIFALEALTILQNKNIYMAEPQEIIRDVNSWNTDKILKDMLKPLLNNYRDIIISSRLTGNLDLIFNTIGKSNFNKINDYLNIVDYLINNEELVEKLSANYIDKTVKKYYAILSKLEDLYHTLGLNNQIYLLKRTI